MALKTGTGTFKEMQMNRMDKKTIKTISAVTPDDLPSINAVLSTGARVELIPVKDGVKVIRVRREEVKK